MMNFKCRILYLLILISSPLIAQEYQANKPISYRGISVFNKDIIWASGSQSTITMTKNGGKSWYEIKIHQADSNLEFRDIHVLNNKEVVVMSAGEGAKSKIYRSSDFGKTWKLVFGNPYGKGFFNAIHFINEKEGILTGDPIEGKLFVLYTRDGGITWNEIDRTKIPSMNEGEFGGYAASGSHITFVDNQWINCTGGKQSRVMLANKDFSLWKVIETPIIQGSGSNGIFSIDFCSSKIGIAVGGEYTTEDQGGQNVILTKDGGMTWNLANTFPVYQSSVRFINCTKLISTGPGGTYISNDSGKNWQKHIEEGFHTLDIADDGSIWAAGSGGRIKKLNVTD